MYQDLSRPRLHHLHNIPLHQCKYHHRDHPMEGQLSPALHSMEDQLSLALHSTEDHLNPALHSTEDHHKDHNSAGLLKMYLHREHHIQLSHRRDHLTVGPPLQDHHRGQDNHSVLIQVVVTTYLALLLSNQVIITES